MTKTSITDYVVGGVMASCVIAVFIFLYVSADSNYDIGDIDTSALEVYGNFSQVTNNANDSISNVYDINADAGLFDVLGGLVVKAFTAIKSFISGIKFMTSNIGNMMGSGLLHIPYPIVIATIVIIGVYIGGVFLFKYLSGKDDEK